MTVACGRLGEKAHLKAFKGSSHTGLLAEDRLIREVLRIASQRSWPAQLAREARFAWSNLKGLLASRDEGGSVRLRQRAMNSILSGCTAPYC